MRVNLKALAAQTVWLVFMIAIPLFGAAGTLAWPAGWAFLLLFFGFVAAITIWLYRTNPALLTERMAGQKSGQKTWDKVLFAVLLVLFLAWLVAMPLDAVRFGWSHMPPLLQWAGGLLMLASFALFFRVFAENSFLSPVVRIQEERGQKVISTGPYHVVRHPMYAAALLLFVGTSLLLGSWIGLLAAAPLVIAMARRAVLEEQTLRRELEGYEAYMGQVKYRLVPGVW
jgi:protein-S-isoprenylcysteine O-methyltransferase Ste14